MGALNYQVMTQRIAGVFSLLVNSIVFYVLVKMQNKGFIDEDIQTKKDAGLYSFEIFKEDMSYLINSIKLFFTRLCC